MARLQSLSIHLPRTFSGVVLALFLLTGQTLQAATVSGIAQKWQPITIDFAGPAASETDTSPNPFLDLRLDVILTSPSGRAVSVPGFFAGNGNGGGKGNIWRARFAADETGTWQYTGRMRSGINVAINNNANTGNSVDLAGSTGSFSISDQSTDASGFLKWGRLDYVGGHYLKFVEGPHWIKSGTDSPENFLGYTGIDGTVDAGGIVKNFLHKYTEHRDHWRSGDPLFSNSKTGEDSLGIIGALNYLSDQGVNSIYFLPMNLGGDGQETFPFVGFQKTRFDKTHYDVSKLHQWNIVLSHAQQRGIALNIVLSETEQENERWLDDGKLGVERKLFFRELIARFGYLLAAKWNLGEENDYPVSELRMQADFIRSLDWSNKPIAVHTQTDNFRDYEKLVGDPSFSASSIQYHQYSSSEYVETWRRRSADAGRPWVIDMDENTGGVTNNNAATRRKQILYDVYFSGGNIEWYFGYHPLPLGGDVTAGNFAARSKIWQFTRYAREFMERELPFWRMEPADNLVTGESDSNGGAEVFAATNETYAVYLPNAAKTATIDLRNANNTFTLRWFNPDNGEFSGGSKQIKGGSRVSLGNPPSRRSQDWVALLQSNDAISAPPAIEVVAQPEAEEPAPEVVQDDALADDAPTASPPANSPPFFADAQVAQATAGELFRFNVTASDADGIAPVISANTLPSGMRFERVDNGVATLVWQVPAEAQGTNTFEITARDVADNNLVATKIIEVSVQAAPEPEVEPKPEQQPVPEQQPEARPESQPQSDPPTSAPQSNLVDQPPSILGATNRTAMVGERIAQVILPIDPEGIVAALRAISLPPGASLEDNGNGTRTLRWTPLPQDKGEHEIVFVATDAGPTPFVTQTAMRIEVIDQTVATAPLFQDDNATQSNNFAPILSLPDTIELSLGQTFSYRINPVDPEGIAPILHIIELPENASFEDNGDGSRTFVWAPAVAGQFKFRVVATDSVDNALSTESPLVLKVVE